MKEPRMDERNPQDMPPNGRPEPKDKHHRDKKHKRKGGFGRFITFLLFIALIAALMYLMYMMGLFEGIGLGGPNSGTGKGNTAGNETSISENEGQTTAANTQAPTVEETVIETTTASVEETIPDVIIVHIELDNVTINGNVVKDADELKNYIEKYNSDSRKFELTEEKSLLETYRWVTGVFEELNIAFSEDK